MAGAQEEDGHWSAARFGGQPEADLRVTTWIVLVYLGDGSPLREEPGETPVEKGVRWLLDQQDEDGRIGLRADPEWLLDHAMATFAVIEAARSTDFEPPKPKVLAAGAALSRALSAARPVPGAEVRLWAFGAAQALRALDDEQARQVAASLAETIAELPQCEEETAVDRAAGQLLREIGGEVPGDSEALPGHGPGEPVADPLTTFYSAATAYLRGGPAWKEAQARIHESVVKTQIHDPKREAVCGTWDPVGEFGEQNGRLGTTAVNTLVLEIYYRYCRLGLFQ